MVNPKNGWLDMLIHGSIAAFVVVVVAMGCASTPTPRSVGGGDEMVQTLGDVSVERDGDGSVIRLDGLVDPVYSVADTDDPTVVVIDLVGVSGPTAESADGDSGDQDRQIAAYDGVVDLVTLSTFDEGGETPLTRVEVVMADAGRADVVSTGDGLEIRIIPGDAAFEAAATGDGSGSSDSSDMADASATDTPQDSEPWGMPD